MRRFKSVGMAWIGATQGTWSKLAMSSRIASEMFENQTRKTAASLCCGNFCSYKLSRVKKLNYFCHIFSSWRIWTFTWCRCIYLIFDFGNRSVWYQMEFWKSVLFLIGLRGNGSFGCFHWKVVVGVLICLHWLIEDHEFSAALEFV